MKIFPGPLPADGERINAEDDLTAFVVGSRLFDFGFEEFADSGVAFMISSTDPPATAARHRAVTWFQRGKGLMHHWHVFTPGGGPDSGEGTGITQGLFLAASGSRKDIGVEARFPVSVGEAVFIDSFPNERHFHQMQYDNMVPRVSGEIFVNAFLGIPFSDTLASLQPFWHENHRDPCFVMLEASSSFLGQSYHPAADMGYVQTQVGCDYTGPAKLLTHQGENVSFLFMDPRATSKNDESLVAHGVESGVSLIAPGTVLAFLRPATSHRDF